MEATFQITNEGEWQRISYVGPINEEAEVHLGKINELAGPKCILNFKQVSYVNSCGVRAWINFLRDFESNREVIFEECTPEIVMQMNMIPNFKGKSHIRSVYATYECDECSHTETVLFEEGQNLPENPDDDLPKVSCQKCGFEEMEMEELEEEYFSFLSAS